MTSGINVAIAYIIVLIQQTNPGHESTGTLKWTVINKVKCKLLDETPCRVLVSSQNLSKVNTSSPLKSMCIQHRRTAWPAFSLESFCKPIFFGIDPIFILFLQFIHQFRLDQTCPCKSMRIKLPQIAKASCLHQLRILCADDTQANFHPSKLRINNIHQQKKINKTIRTTD